MAEAGAQRARAEQLPDGEDAIADHLARLFVARHVEMWKSAEVTKLLRATLSASAGYGEFRTVGALTQTQQNALSSAPSPSSSSPASASAWVALTQPPSYELLTSCLELREEDVLGSAGAVIPANLLDPEDTEEEARRAQAQIEAQLGGAMQNRALNPLEEDALLRFRALYGPLAPGQQGGGDASPAEQLRAYRFRFTSEGHVGANLGQEGILMLFVRTLLPWNSTEEMALRRLLEERGIADPVATRTAEERARDAELRREMEDADAAEWESLDSYTDEEEEAGGADGVAGGDVD